MFPPGQLLASTVIILLLSCNNSDKQNEQGKAPGLVKDTVATVSKPTEINTAKTRVTEKKRLACKAKKSPIPIPGNSNLKVNVLNILERRVVYFNQQDIETHLGTKN